MSGNYFDPVAKLLTRGDRGLQRGWMDYRKLGLGPEHIPDLIRMATDAALHEADWESPEVWAPIHAWRALGQLRAVAAIVPLMTLLGEFEENDDIDAELPTVLGMIGSPSVEPLADYLSAPSHSDVARIRAAQCLEAVGKADSNARAACVDALTRALRAFDRNTIELNGFLVAYLLDLKAVETIDMIREAFAAERVDLSISGDVEDVEIELGLRARSETPARNWGIPLTATQARVPPKTGRNDPCPCGSGKKHKKCCLGKPSD